MSPTTCAICGRQRSVHTRHGDVCTSCRFFTDDKPPGDWARHGACVGQDPELFHGERWNNRYAEAIAICSTCPVINQCLDYAINTNINDGVWGGLTAHQRRQLTRAH